MKCGHRSDCLSFLIRQVDNEVVPLDMCSPNACFQTLYLGKAGLEFPQVLGDRCVCVWPGWEVGVGSMKGVGISFTSIWEASVPAGYLQPGDQATAQVP